MRGIVVVVGHGVIGRDAEAGEPPPIEYGVFEWDRDLVHAKPIRCRISVAPYPLVLDDVALQEDRDGVALATSGPGTRPPQTTTAGNAEECGTLLGSRVIERLVQ